MNSGNRWNGMVQAELTGADPERILYALNQAGIRMYRVCWTAPLTVQFLCVRRDCRRIQAFCEKQGCALRFGPETGISFRKRLFRERPILATGLILLLLLTFFLPTRVLFFRVEGNVNIPSRQILEAMEACGIRFGASRREVRSEKMKNVLLEAMPGLKWAGINTSGCTAVVSVREREIPPSRKEPTGITGIVAAADGYVTACTVVKGTGLCEPGQIVRAGQLLISGYADHGICIQATGAEGEIFAQTSRSVNAVTLSQWQQRVGEPLRKYRFSLILGKKRINLWKCSSFWDDTCGRMYEEYYLTLPGGFRLPVCLGVETLTHWQTVDADLTAGEMEAGLKEYARYMVLEQTIAGTILQESHSFHQTDGAYGVRSRFLCAEMIGRVITEEIGEFHGKTD